MKWLYRRDFSNSDDLYKQCEYWKQKGYRVFIQGYSAMDVVEYK